MFKGAKLTICLTIIILIFCLTFKVQESFQSKTPKIYCFWTGTNPITPNRIRALESLKQNSGAEVILVTPNNLPEYILKDFPLHPGFQYLSETHKADYLRWYFMHHHGGGYSDIKNTKKSWKSSFETLEQSDKWVIGYQEVQRGVCSQHPNVRDNYQKLIGNGAYIFKPYTPITTEWGKKIHQILDQKLERLKKNPSKFPQDQYGVIYEGKSSKYPLEWAEICGCLLADILSKYLDKVLQGLPQPDFTNYR